MADQLLCGGGPQHDMDMQRRGLCRDCDGVRELLAGVRRETARECLEIVARALIRGEDHVPQVRERFGLEDGDD